MIYDAICWTASSTMNLKTAVLQDLQQQLFTCAKTHGKKILLSPEDYQVAHRYLCQHLKRHHRTKQGFLLSFLKSTFV